MKRGKKPPVRRHPRPLPTELDAYRQTRRETLDKRRRTSSRDREYGKAGLTVFFAILLVSMSYC